MRGAGLNKPVVVGTYIVKTLVGASEISQQKAQAETRGVQLPPPQTFRPGAPGGYLLKN